MITRNRIVLVSVVALVALADFALRVHVGRDPALRDYVPPRVVAVPAALSGAAVRADLVTWMPVLTAALGQADAAHAPAWTLDLLGVFDERGRRTAVFRAHSAAGGAPQRIAAVVGDEIHGARVEQIGTRSVDLMTSDGPRALRLFDSTAPSSLQLQAAAGGAGTTLATPAQATRAAPPVTSSVAPAAAPGPTPQAAASRAADEPQVPQQVQAGQPLKSPWNLPFSNPEQAAQEAAAFTAPAAEGEQSTKK